MKISRKSDIQAVASIVCDCLLKAGVQAVLSGGAVVSIYTKNEYESKDLDFISTADKKTIEEALATIGFKRASTRHYTHPNTEFFVEFPSPPLSIGNMPIREWVTQNNKEGKLLLLSPTHSVMDRLAGYFHWKDKQNLDQAVLIAKHQTVRMKTIESWAKSEGHMEGFREFKSRLK